MQRFLFCLLVLTLGCQEPQSESTTPTEPENAYQEYLQQALTAHGGLDSWKSWRTLSYIIPEEDAGEIHTIDLWDRRDRVDMELGSMGYDGTEVWLDADSSYEGNAEFYHNLMFYFFAMPFVLSDDGIQYSDTTALEFEGKTYPAVKVAYDNGVGASDKDEYIMYLDPETNQMAWLAYTATYFSGEKSEKFNLIRYHDWKQVENVWLPDTITWYKHDAGLPLEPSGSVGFTEVSLSTEAKPDAFYAAPQGS